MKHKSKKNKHQKHTHEYNHDNQATHHYHTNFDMDHTIRFMFVIMLNGILTLAQIIAGFISGSLTLLADALHNFSDMLSLLVAFFSHKISKKPPNAKKTFSYRRAEVIGAFINVILLFSTGLYLIFESILRYFNPHAIEGKVVIIVAIVALIIDLATAAIVYLSPKKTMNIKVAFIHNLSDALASIAVIITGIVIVKYKFYIIDSIVTLLIAGYVLYHSFMMLPRIINILMNNTPNNKIFEEVQKSLLKIKQVKDVHHLHIWRLDEDRIALECHLVVDNCMLVILEKLRKDIKNLLKKKYKIAHSTIEFECNPCSPKKC